LAPASILSLYKNPSLLDGSLVIKAVNMVTQSFNSWWEKNWIPSKSSITRWFNKSYN